METKYNEFGGQIMIWFICFFSIAILAVTGLMAVNGWYCLMAVPFLLYLGYWSWTGILLRYRNMYNTNKRGSYERQID